MHPSNLWVVVPAAGAGRRLEADRPKQYLPLGAGPVIAHTIAKVGAVRGIAGIAVAVAPADPWWDETAAGLDVPVVRVDGGPERHHSVANALEYLSAIADDDDSVMVHDAARPCVRIADIERLVAVARGQPQGGILAAPVHVTIKRAGPGGRIEGTMDRDRLWRALTPQLFPLGRLRAALRSVIASGTAVTDEAEAMERAGARPLLVEGSPDNIKITRAEDLVLARALVDVERRVS